ncbi:hypothetical protein DL96DRAFT_1684324 [Flagelloscypha sp. PMI_526]|nr:hypothetical protein DL96DRAFT_1684324 [Flagelloscypha sp. PMI_526]
METPLHVSEICSVICEYLNSRSLSRLARTTSAFRDPALDILYGRTINIETLMRCLPSDLLTVQREVPKNAASLPLVLSRNIVEGDVPKIMRYFQRVKRLCLFGNGAIWIPALRELASNVRVPYLFPNIRHVWIGISAALLLDPSLYFGPDAQTVSFQSNVEEVGYSWLPILSKHCSALQRMRFSPGFGVNMSFETSSLLTSFQKLIEVVLILPISSSDFQILGTCPALQKLEFDGQNVLNSWDIEVPSLGFPSLRRLKLPRLYSPELVPSFAAGSFPQLQKVHVSGITPDSTERLLYAISTSAASLVSFKSRMEDFTQREHFLSLFSYLRYWSGTLEKIEISALGRPHDSGLWHFSHVCAPLLSLNRMRRLILWIGPPSGLTMTDQDAFEIGRQWKSLQELRILLSTTTEGGISLKGLVALASECPRLTSAVIPVSYVQVPHSPEGSCNISLRWLAVGCAAIENEVSIANFFKISFPNLKIIRPDSDLPEPYNERWARVKELLGDRTGPGEDPDEESDDEAEFNWY